MSSRNWASPCGPGCWLRSSPASGSFPSRAAIPDAASRDLATANPIGSSSQVPWIGTADESKVYAPNASNGNDNVAKQLRVVRKTAFVDVVHTDDARCRTGWHSCADERCALCSAHHASGEKPSPLSNGLSLVLVRPSTINPQGVRYASVRPLRLRLRGDRSRPRTSRPLSSGDGPRRKTGAFQCRTISRSLRTMPLTWPAR